MCFVAVLPVRAFDRHARRMLFKIMALLRKWGSEYCVRSALFLGHVAGATQDTISIMISLIVDDAFGNGRARKNSDSSECAYLLVG